jgi:DNA-directed RNA polymerase subunit E'/Rpb7
MTSAMTLFNPVFLEQRITLGPSEFAELSKVGSVDAFLTTKISKALEGQCCMHGYVKPGSTQILARSMGQAEHGRFTGDFLYYCKVRVLCLLPEAGQILDARILKKNKMGVYALLVDEGKTLEAMRILIPRDGYIGDAEFDTLEESQSISVKIVRTRFQINDAFIQGLAELESIEGMAVVEEQPEEVEA